MPDARLRQFDRLQGLAARALGRLPARLQLALSGRPALVVDGQTLDPQLQLLLALQRRRSPHGLCEPSPAEGRARFRRDVLAATRRQTAVGAVREFDIQADRSVLRARHYAPDAPARDLLVYLHGGGFVIGDLDTHDEPCRLLCRHAETHVLSVDYRLAPEHPFPAGLDDALAALGWAQANAPALGADAGRVALGGDSAGANLSAVAARLTAAGGRPPCAQLLIYPATDAVTERPSQELFGEGLFLTRADRDAFSRHYLGAAGVRADDPRVSPLLAGDLAGLPPALVVTAGFDLLRDEGEAYADALSRAGVTVRARRFQALAHGFVNMTSVAPSARAATVEIARDWHALLDEISGLHVAVTV